MQPSSLRVYGGVEGDDRKAERRAQFLEAGLDLLGSDEATLSVRGACKQAGLAARYFYESFTDREALAAAVYDHVIEDLAHRTLAAVAEAPFDARAKARAGLSTLVGIVGDDPRRGRLLFSAQAGAALAERRQRSTLLFVGLLGGQAKDFYGLPDSADLEVLSQFAVGGLAQTLTAWLDGTLRIEREALVEHCTNIFLAVGDVSPH
ncbi:TetR/AcrR family transcriptional regulator [Saccharopolyspora sp. NFXS83]|uniref:TetR/AcrR family transcriptional regulator n=1 Tax=Saccharopolyspora sp. NFXS83 TaxID=2993560 RepID=UPI00224ADE75|nr:TetR/AcrR family transcriptional regulator [Saccharopolyspora sp. NFXS83]MCX2734229.1 TetR/AcrR family transcriptional regulator [Saccharopolyspora sp. NFXS83]